MEPLPLVCHPSTPCNYVSAVTARVDRLSEDLLILYYEIVGDIDQLQLPPQRAPGHGLASFSATRGGRAVQRPPREP